MFPSTWWFLRRPPPHLVAEQDLAGQPACPTCSGGRRHERGSDLRSSTFAIDDRTTPRRSHAGRLLLTASTTVLVRTVLLRVAVLMLVSGSSLLTTPTAEATTTAAERGTYVYDGLASSTTPATQQRAVAPIGRSSPRTSAGSSTFLSVPVRATKAGDDAAQRTVAALTREQDAGLKAALGDPNKFRHVFDDPGHKLDPLVRELGGRDAVLREAVLAVPRSQTGIFQVSRRVGRYNLTVRGNVVNGVPRIGTVFVP